MQRRFIYITLIRETKGMTYNSDKRYMFESENPLGDGAA